MSKRFEGKVVLITGASAGIGLAAAQQFAAEGARVVLVARGHAALAEAVAAICDDGGEALAVVGDVGDDGSCRGMLDRTLDQFGQLDILVNNAGLHQRGRFDSRTAEDLAAMVDINLRAPIVLTRLALTALKQSQGTIVNVASLAGRVPVPESAVYSATKFGLRALSYALAEELSGSGVTVSVVSPGPVDTGFIMDDVDNVSDLSFSQPISTADQVAAAVLACAADGKRERALPASSGVLTNVAYMMPWLGRRLRPLMERKGRKVKDRLRKTRS